MSELPTSGTLPAVRLPPACETRWLVELRRLGFGQALAVAETDGNHWNTERLWERMPRPVLGELVVPVTALGKASAPGLRRMVAVAEGLTASYAPALRLPREEGLEAAEVILIPSRGMTVAPSAAVLAAEVTAIDVACVVGEAVLPLRVTPPHWRVRIEPEPGSGGTATGPGVVLRTLRPGPLHAHGNRSAEPRLIVAWPGCWRPASSQDAPRAASPAPARCTCNSTASPTGEVAAIAARRQRRERVG